MSEKKNTNFTENGQHFGLLYVYYYKGKSSRQFGSPFLIKRKMGDRKDKTAISGPKHR